MKIFGFFVFLLTITSASAQEISMQCTDGCLYPADEARNFARTNGLASGAIVNVIEIDDFVTRTYSVDAFPNQRDPSQTIYMVSSIPTSASTLQTIDDIKDVFETIQSYADQFSDDGLISNPCAGPGGVVNSGWDLVGCRQAQTAFLNKIYDGSYVSAFQTAGGIIDALRSQINLDILDARIPLEVLLSDGSRIVLSFSYVVLPENGESATRYEINFKRSTDGSGINLDYLEEDSLNQSGSSGDGPIYFWESTTLNDFIAAAGRMGLIVDTNGGPVIGMECEWREQEKKLVCVGA